MSRQPHVKSLAPSQPYAMTGTQVFGQEEARLRTAEAQYTVHAHTWTRGHHERQQAASSSSTPKGKTKTNKSLLVFFPFPFSAPARREIRSGAPKSPPARAPLANRMAGVIYRSNTASNPCSGPHPFLAPLRYRYATGPCQHTCGFLSALQKDTLGPSTGGRGPTRGVGTRPVGRPFWCAPLGNSQGQGGEGGRKGRVERATVV